MLRQCKKHLLLGINRYGDTSFMIAAEEGHLSIVRWLLYNGADINAKNMYFSDLL